MNWVVSETEDGWIVRSLDDLPFRAVFRPRHFSGLTDALEYGQAMIRANGPGYLILVTADGGRISRYFAHQNDTYRSFQEDFATDLSSLMEDEQHTPEVRYLNPCRLLADPKNLI